MRKEGGLNVDQHHRRVRSISDGTERISVIQVAELTATVDSMNQTITDLNQTIKELKEQLNKNSKNSSKPPSSDGLKKPAVKKDKSLRESSGKKQEAQEGHDGVHLSFISDSDHIENHIHSDCTGCPIVQNASPSPA